MLSQASDTNRLQLPPGARSKITSRYLSLVKLSIPPRISMHWETQKPDRAEKKTRRDGSEPFPLRVPSQTPSDPVAASTTMQPVVLREGGRKYLD